MGFVRGGLFVIVSVLFFIGLLVANSLFVVTSSLDYENLKQELIPVVKDALNEKINITSLIEKEKFPAMQKFCQNQNASQELEYVFNEQGYTFVVPCSAIANGPEEIVNSAVDSLFYEYYYKTYECGFFDCFEKDSIPFFLVSEQSKNYWQEKLYFSLLALVILLVLMFLFIEKKTNLPLVVGSLMIVSALPFLKLESFLTFIPGEFLKFLAVVFAQSYKIFLIALIAGIVMLAIGIILKFFAIGFKINEFFSRLALKRQKEKKIGEKQKIQEEKKQKKKV